jgi:transposase
MYLEGLGFRSIGRILKISYGTVYQWVKKWGSNMTLPKRNEDIELVELDEMHTYVGRKKTTNGYGLLLIDMENGLSLLSVVTGQQKQD